MQGVADQETELQSICRWRREELERAGYEREYADLLANSFDVDLHDAIDLLRQGCKQSTAVLILL